MRPRYTQTLVVYLWQCVSISPVQDITSLVRITSDGGSIFSKIVQSLFLHAEVQNQSFSMLCSDMVVELYSKYTV